MQVFIEDASTPGRYSLAAEMKDRPTGAELMPCDITIKEKCAAFSASALWLPAR